MKERERGVGGTRSQDLTQVQAVFNWTVLQRRETSIQETKEGGRGEGQGEERERERVVVGHGGKYREKGYIRKV